MFNNFFVNRNLNWVDRSRETSLKDNKGKLLYPHLLFVSQSCINFFEIFYTFLKIENIINMSVA